MVGRCMFIGAIVLLPIEAWLSGSGRTAMKRRKWRLEQKALIVLEGLKRQPIGFSRKKNFLWRPRLDEHQRILERKRFQYPGRR